MNRENMLRMSERELDAYARSMGFSAHAAKGAEAKADLIDARRNRSVTVSALGVELEVTLKAAHDERFSALIGSATRTDEDVRRAFRLLLGDEQYEALVAAATDEDGTVDGAALSFGLNQILSSDELKNY